MRVNFDIVGPSVDKSRAIYLHFLLVLRFNIESRCFSLETRSILTELEASISDRGGRERVREIFEIIYRAAHYGSGPRNGGHSLAY